ncbi:MAG: 50S ribosomal protein L9 [Candidatus Nanopelagicales bacterium]
MKLILTSEVDGLGGPGDIVDVKPGYGRNYLVPRGFAMPWSKGSEKQIVAIKRARDAREIRDLGHAREVRDQLEALTITVNAKAGETGKLFGSVTNADVVVAVRKAGGPLLDKRSIEVHGIKTIGKHKAVVRVHPQVQANVVLEVVSV